MRHGQSAHPRQAGDAGIPPLPAPCEFTPPPAGLAWQQRQGQSVHQTCQPPSRFPSCPFHAAHGHVASCPCCLDLDQETGMTGAATCRVRRDRRRRPRPLRGRGFVSAHAPRGRSVGRFTTWRHLWETTDSTLVQRGYARSSRAEHRTVIRNFSRFVGGTPGQVAHGDVRRYLHHLANSGSSWIWLGMNISGLRNILDKMGGMSVTNGITTPKRPSRLPVLLSGPEVQRFLACAVTPRDRLLLGLLYGSGLKVGEACRIRWSDLDVKLGTLSVRGQRGRPPRKVRLPDDILPLLGTGASLCPPDAYVFPGRTSGRPLSTRAAESVVRAAGHLSGIPKVITAMTLRHTHAVHCLENGWS
ncbi:MAG: hypothetical protein FJ224_00750, partial [Lentisphaerae bacterium]|nr:hypothetical protein [Lentisphaerota bacterium]